MTNYSRIDRIKQAMSQSTQCSTCKHRGDCNYQPLMSSWRYLGSVCNIWEKWNG
jgi:hypothetical protein